MKLGPVTDPELLELLREICADPKSRLMKLATQGADLSLNLHERPLSEGEPFLTRAERHLVREHREQVARLLFEEGKRECLEASPLETGVYRGAFAGWTPVVPISESLRERETLLRIEPTDEEASNAIRASDTGAGRFGLTQALASMRLVPRDSGRNLIGLAFIAAGRRVEGCRALEDILGHRSSVWYRSVALQNRAYELRVEGRLQESKSLYAESSRLQPSRPEPLIGLLETNLLAMDLSGALSAAATLADLDAGACLDEHMMYLPARLESECHGGSSAVSRFANGLLNRLPSCVVPIARAFARQSKGVS